MDELEQDAEVREPTSSITLPTAPYPEAPITRISIRLRDNTAWIDITEFVKSVGASWGDTIRLPKNIRSHVMCEIPKLKDVM